MINLDLLIYNSLASLGFGINLLVLTFQVPTTNLKAALMKPRIEVRFVSINVHCTRVAVVFK